MSIEYTDEFRNSYIPVRLWSKDHWSTFAYLEAIEVDRGGIKVQYDPRMRHCRRNFRVMPGPKHRGVVMSPEHSTRLSDGRLANGHDDWHCVQDMAAVELSTAGPEAVEPLETLHLSELGREVIAALRAHKAGGGNWANFQPPLVLLARESKLAAEADTDAAKAEAEERNNRLLAT